MSESKIRKWIAARLGETDVPHAFRLVHTSEQGNETVLQLSSSGDNLELVALTLAEKFQAAAEEHLESYGGQQRYRVAAIGDGNSDVGGYSFKLESEEDHAFGHLSDSFVDRPTDHEPATEKGLLAQLMRHLEKREQNMNVILEGVVGTLAAENKSLRSHSAKVEEMRLDYMVRIENLMSQQHERDLEVKQADAQIERTNKMLERAFAFAPDAFKKISNHLLPEGEKTDKKTNGSNGSNGANGAMIKIHQLQAALGSIVHSMGGVRAFTDNLDEEHHEELFNVLGIGSENIESADELGKRAQSVIFALDGDFMMKLSSELTDEQAALLKGIVGTV